MNRRAAAGFLMAMPLAGPMAGCVEAHVAPTPATAPVHATNTPASAPAGIAGLVWQFTAGPCRRDHTCVTRLSI